VYKPQKLSGYFTTGGASGPLDDESTMVRISEGTWPETQDNLERSYGNCEGWMQMISCIKVYLEHGFNLRDEFFK
jgi:hypothetical protein